MKKSGKRMISFILTAFMVFALLPVVSKPMAVKADDIPVHVAHEDQDTKDSLHSGWTKISTWDDLKKLGENGGSGYLGNKIEISETFRIESGKIVNLCLNGYSITQTADATDTISVYGTLNLYDKKDNLGILTHSDGKKGCGVSVYRGTFTMNGGTISGNEAKEGCGVTTDHGTFTMNGGTISGNEATLEGGGVYNYGTFTMNGGAIEGNNATYGGGVSSYEGTFTMNGGTIKGNNASYGGGVKNIATFIMNGGTIEGNKVRLHGGGVSNSETFTMNGGTISGNEAEEGGGVNNSKNFIMNNGTISDNEAWYGGGVYNNRYSTFTMKDGTIKWNKVSSDGGGVYNKGTFTMINGAIKENNAKSGGAVYIGASFTKEGGEIDGSIESWNRNFCTVEFNSNDETDKTIIQYVTPNTDTSLAPNKFSYGNYKFGCWNTMANYTGNSYQDKATINVNSNLVLYPRWIEKSYDVTFKVNNGSWSDKTKDDKVVTIFRYVGEYKELKLYVSDIPLLGNPNTGYRSGKWDAKHDTVNELTENKTYTYTFVPIEYTVKFDANGGEGNMDDQSRTYDDKTALTENDFTLEGYTFNGWNTAADGSGTYFAESSTDNITSIDKATVTLFAQWRANNYTVKYDSNGGKGNMDNQSRTYDDKAALTANTFTLEGYTFTGWKTGDDGSGISYADGSTDIITSKDGDTVTLYAQWRVNNYTVKYDSNGGEGNMDDQSRIYDDKIALTENAFTFEGKTFNGWNTAADGSGTPYANEEVNNISSKDGDIVTLYAQWTIDTFTITWKDYDGTVLETDSDVAYGAMPEYNGETPKRGDSANIKYTFIGWTPEIDTVKGATTYTATYSEEEIIEPTEPTTPEEPTEPGTEDLTDPESDPDIPDEDWLDDLRLQLRIADELGGPRTVTYSGDFALSYDIMLYLVEHPDITFIYTVTYEDIEYTITIPAGKAIADPEIPWYGPLWLLANYGN